MKKFTADNFINRLSKRLIDEFDESSFAGTPGLIGSAKEHPARKQLELILPPRVNIGTGIVIDSFGGQSLQQDIIVYDRQFCPVFSINGTPEATYFPCEGVIAVGEVKSTITDSELQDSLRKIASVKKLRRYCSPSSPTSGGTIPYRSYGSSMCLIGTIHEQYDQLNKSSDQIFGFVLCNKFGLVPKTMTARLSEYAASYPKNQAFNFIASLNDGFFKPMDEASNSLKLSFMDGDTIARVDHPEIAFPQLVRSIDAISAQGRTVSTDVFARYFTENKTVIVANKQRINFTS